MPNYQVKTYATIEEDLSEDEIKEYLKCAGDCQYFIENYVRVQHPTLGSVLFKLYDYQERALNGLINHDKTIMLMPRQVGKCFFINTIVKIRNKHTKQVEEITIGELYEKAKRKYINIK